LINYLKLLLIVLILLIVLSCKTVTNEFYGTKFNNNQNAFLFTLTNQYNKPISLNENKDIKIVTFLFSNCTDVCPTITLKLREVYETLSQFNDKFTIIVITVDPENDTPASALEYSKSFNMEDKWDFLTGEKKILSEIWKNYYISQWVKDSKNPLISSINHSAPIYIIDHNEIIKVVHTDPIVPQEIAHDIKLLINN